MQSILERFDQLEESRKQVDIQKLATSEDPADKLLYSIAGLGKILNNIELE